MTALLFWVLFGATLVLLVVALVSGLRRRRRVHLVAGPAALVALTGAVLATEQLVSLYSFPEDILRVHLICAKTAGVLALVVAATGVWLWKRPAARRWHRLAVFVFLGGAVIATGTGLWMFGHGEAK